MFLRFTVVARCSVLGRAEKFRGRSGDMLSRKIKKLGLSEMLFPAFWGWEFNQFAEF